MTATQLREAIGLAYTTPENQNKELDATLANAIVEAARPHLTE